MIRSTSKRSIDIVVAGFGLALFAPLLAVVAAVVRVRLGPPVFFRQLRPGLNGEPFELVKFRTMDGARGENGELLEDEVRLGNLGRWLRRWSIDEIPELWNVARGDMSLVGPRPLLMEYLPLYTAEQSRRHEARPGLTGLAQVSGRNELSWERRFELDVWYVDNWSTALDTKILAMTAKAVLTGRGVASPGHATMQSFEGSPGRGSRVG